MTPLVVDTDVISYAFKGHSLAVEYNRLLSNRSLPMSSMTLAELDRWTLLAGWGAARMKRLEPM